MNKELQSIRCSGCGRFQGKGSVKDGEVYILCSKCKSWVAVLGEIQENTMTGSDMAKRIMGDLTKRKK